MILNLPESLFLSIEILLVTNSWGRGRRRFKSTSNGYPLFVWTLIFSFFLFLLYYVFYNIYEMVSNNLLDARISDDFITYF